jgi:chromosome segregation ATPase
MVRKADEVHVKLFKGAARAVVEVALLEEELKKAHQLIEENQWGKDEGYHIIFANGLHYLCGERDLRSLNCDHDALAGEVQRLSKELMDLHSKYAVMKFNAFQLIQTNQTLEFNLVGLRKSEELSTYRLKKFREDEESLRKELRSLRQENKQLRQRLATLEGQAELPRPEPSFIRKLLHHLGRG